MTEHNFNWAALFRARRARIHFTITEASWLTGKLRERPVTVTVRRLPFRVWSVQRNVGFRIERRRWAWGLSSAIELFHSVDLR